MGQIEPDDPIPDSGQPTPPPAGEGRADWLCGPEEGLDAELERLEREKGAGPRPTLLRPAAPGAEATPAAPPSAAGTPPNRRFGAVLPDSASDFVPGMGMTWEPGPRSVPTVRRDPPSGTFVREPTRDFPMDDAEERARVNAMHAADAAMAAAVAGMPHAVVSPDAFNTLIVPVPWWMQIPHVIGSDRRIQGMIASALVLLVAIVMWPRGERPVSLGSLRHHPERFDGVEVKVEGRVGEVFPVGQGFAFYLHDGRDTLVVFTRSRHPVPREHVSLNGKMSRGYLDGLPRLALFESYR